MIGPGLFRQIQAYLQWLIGAPGQIDSFQLSFRKSRLYSAQQVVNRQAVIRRCDTEFRFHFNRGKVINGALDLTVKYQCDTCQGTDQQHRHADDSDNLVKFPQEPHRGPAADAEGVAHLSLAWPPQIKPAEEKKHQYYSHDTDNGFACIAGQQGVMEFIEPAHGVAAPFTHHQNPAGCRIHAGFHQAIRRFAAGKANYMG